MWIFQAWYHCPVQAAWHPKLYAQPHRAGRPGSLVCGDHLRTALGSDTSGGTYRQAVVQLAGVTPDIVCKPSYADQLWGLAKVVSCRLSSAEICTPEMQVRLPFHDVYTLFQLGVFKRQAVLIV